MNLRGLKYIFKLKNLVLNVAFNYIEFFLEPRYDFMLTVFFTLSVFYVKRFPPYMY